MCADRNTDNREKGVANGRSDEEKNTTMSKSRQNLSIEVEDIKAVCPLGEVVGKRMVLEERIPVISCEGGCFRGEIARLAAHMVAKHGPYSRGCHGEMFTAPSSAMAEWARKANKVVVIDGCFMRCHGRIMKNIVGYQNMVQFDALRIYNKDNKYSDIMLVDEIPEPEREDLARQVADKILASLEDGTPCHSESQPSYDCKLTVASSQKRTMAVNNARRFVEKMKQDEDFRRKALDAKGPEDLLSFLRQERLSFNQRELVEAMAECMEQLELETGK
ncbi:MAG: Nif11-like leader peptide family RiPP precursor [Planctomycetota bacterium]|jgi:predicted ribosomally synthesized peptide with nif11-like leader